MTWSDVVQEVVAAWQHEVGNARLPAVQPVTVSALELGQIGWRLEVQGRPAHDVILVPSDSTDASSLALPPTRFCVAAQYCIIRISHLAEELRAQNDSNSTELMRIQMDMHDALVRLASAPILTRSDAGMYERNEVLSQVNRAWVELDGRSFTSGPLEVRHDVDSATLTVGLDGERNIALCLALVADAYIPIAALLHLYFTYYLISDAKPAATWGQMRTIMYQLIAFLHGDPPVSDGTHIQYYSLCRASGHPNKRVQDLPAVMAQLIGTLKASMRPNLALYNGLAPADPAKSAQGDKTPLWFLQNSEMYRIAAQEVADKYANTAWFDTSLWTETGTENAPQLSNLFVTNPVSRPSSGGAQPQGVPASSAPGTAVDMKTLTGRIKKVHATLQEQIQTVPMSGANAAVASSASPSTIPTQPPRQRLHQVGGAEGYDVAPNWQVLSELGIVQNMRCASPEATKKTKILSSSLFDARFAFMPLNFRDDTDNPLRGLFPWREKTNLLGGAESLVPRMDSGKDFTDYCQLLCQCLLMYDAHMPSEWGIRIYIDGTAMQDVFVKTMNTMCSKDSGCTLLDRVQVVHVTIPTLKQRDGSAHERFMATMLRHLAFFDDKLERAVLIDVDNYPSPQFMQHILHWDAHPELGQWIGVRPRGGHFGQIQNGLEYCRRTWYKGVGDGEQEPTRHCIPQIIAWCFGCRKVAGTILHPAVWVNMLEYLARGCKSFREDVRDRGEPCDKDNFAKTPFEFSCDEQAPANVLSPLIFRTSPDKGGGMWVIPTTWGFTIRWWDWKNGQSSGKLMDNLYTNWLYWGVFKYAQDWVVRAFQEHIPPVRKVPSTTEFFHMEAMQNGKTPMKRRQDIQKLPQEPFDISNQDHHRWIGAPLRVPFRSQKQYDAGEWFDRYDNQTYVQCIMYLALWEIMRMGPDAFNIMFSKDRPEPEQLKQLPDYNDTRSPFEAIVNVPAFPYYAFYAGGDYMDLTWSDVCGCVVKIAQLLKQGIRDATIATQGAQPTAGGSSARRRGRDCSLKSRPARG